ncbi:hypothetical protein [Streptomyces sp. NPDC021224]|uniref:hypothetical protein n=1 Tax=unclassified Streptomyces TaxID=2593676 RepID=UPI00379DB191
MTFTFGIYPGAALGGETGLIAPARPDDPRRIADALDTLQGDAGTFLVRAYRAFGDPGLPDTPADPASYATRGRALDLVLTFRDPHGDVDGWLDFVSETVRTDGAHLARLQIAEEPNANLPVLDGSTPHVKEAVVRGVTAAKQAARLAGHDIAVGFNAVPTFDPDDSFWPGLGRLADDAFHQALDYVGLDFFPDVFRPLPAGQLPGAVGAVLDGFRGDALPRAGIGPRVPIVVTETGWPTGPGRSEERQAEVVAEVVRTVHERRTVDNITGYTYFGLRDADTSGPGLFHGFGLLRDDYTSKPAFDTYRRLVADLTARPQDARS